MIMPIIMNGLNMAARQQPPPPPACLLPPERGGGACLPSAGPFLRLSADDALLVLPEEREGRDERDEPDERDELDDLEECPPELLEEPPERPPDALPMYFYLFFYFRGRMRMPPYRRFYPIIS